MTDLNQQYPSFILQTGTSFFEKPHSLQRLHLSVNVEQPMTSLVTGVKIQQEN